MYRQKIPQKTTSPLVNSTPISNAAPTSSYGSLSSIVQRAQQDINSISGDERQQLESAIGTKATGEVLAGKQWTPEFKGVSSQLWGNAGIQAKLTIGEVGDKYEQEADRVAASVVEQINRPATVSPTQGEMVQGKEQEEEEELRMKPMVQRKEAIGGGEASAELSGEINRARGGGQPLDTRLQQTMGQAMGADFSGVRVHTDGRSDQLNQSIQAKAFTTGQDVFFRQNEYQPTSRGGQELIAHELTHVVQQTGTGIRTPNKSEGKTADWEGIKRKGETWGAIKDEKGTIKKANTSEHDKEEIKDIPHIKKMAHRVGDGSGKTRKVQRSTKETLKDVDVDIYEGKKLVAMLMTDLEAETEGSGLIERDGDGILKLSSKGIEAQGGFKLYIGGHMANLREYEIGFLQTVLESERTGFYETTENEKKKRKSKTLKSPGAMRDGTDNDVPPWYDENSVKDISTFVNTKPWVTMSDVPGHPFEWRWTFGMFVKGKEQRLVKTGGMDKFRTYLAVKKRGKNGGKATCLAYFEWKVDYSTDIKWENYRRPYSYEVPTVKQSANNGVDIIKIGSGDGGIEPKYGSKLKDKQNWRWWKMNTWSPE